MEISRLDERTVVLAGLNSFLVDLLHQISSAANPEGSTEAQARLYSTPTAGAEPEFDEEWAEFVLPDLQEYFASSLEIVRGDLAGLPPMDAAEGEYQLQIPTAHLESWIHALNQARLALTARHDVSEKEMSALPLSGGPRALSVFQIHFYGFLQECFLRHLEEEP